MEFINQIRRFILLFLLRRKTAVSKNRNPVTIQHAEKIGILFNAENIKTNDVILEFSKYLKSLQKEVQLLGYLPKREFGFQYSFPFISEKDTNWYGKPKGGTSSYFINTPFDLTINFCADECLPLEYISGASSSKFRVGFNKEINNANYDLILIPKENKDISNLIQNLEHYLK
ncbi:MAG: hypothetical protein KAX69_07735 [Chitinophagales bacterium]|nr:hypothetical protein [Chitinophagales bacterium]